MSEDLSVVSRFGGRRQEGLRRCAGAGLLAMPLASLAVGLLVIGLTGCSRGPSLPAPVNVSGVVTYKGEPLADAVVVFSPIAGSQAGPADTPAKGLTDKEGRYQLSTFADKDGAIPGEKQVAVLPAGVVSGRPTKSDDGSESSPDSKLQGFPKKYLEQGASGLKATVEAGKKNTFDFALTDEK